MADDQELADDQLPAGHTPIWIQPPAETTHIEMLERVENMVGEFNDVLVLYRQHDWDDNQNDWDDDQQYWDDRRRSICSDASDDSDVGAEEWCAKRGWRYLEDVTIYGCEAQCVVLLECGLDPELITRGRNMLIIMER